MADLADRWKRLKRATFIRATLIGGELPTGPLVTWRRTSDAAAASKRDTSGNLHISCTHNKSLDTRRPACQMTSEQLINV